MRNLSISIQMRRRLQSRSAAGWKKRFDGLRPYHVYVLERRIRRAHSTGCGRNGCKIFVSEDKQTQAEMFCTDIKRRARSGKFYVLYQDCGCSDWN